MKSALLLLSLATAGWVLVPTGPDARSPAEDLLGQGLLPEAGVSALSCKPSAPIEVKLSQVSGGHAGPARLAFEVTPLRELESLDWKVSLPNGVVLLEGDALGGAIASRGVQTRGEMLIDLPADGAYRSVSVEAHGRFASIDEAGETVLEPIVGVSHVTWGEPRADVEFRTQIGARGDVEQAAVVPSTWHPRK